MEVIREGEGGPSEMERLAQSLEISPSGPASAANDEADEAAKAEAVKQLNAAAGAMIFGLLKAVRSRVARKLPEIREEWPDELLRVPADAAVPVAQKHLGRFLKFGVGFEEEGALAVAMLPLVMGYLSASEKNANTVQDVQAKP